MFKISFASRILNFIGSALIATPEKLKMPEDFYYAPGDRLLPSSSEYALPRTRPHRIAVDAFRRRLTVGVAIGASALAFVFWIVLAVISSFVSSPGSRDATLRILAPEDFNEIQLHRWQPSGSSDSTSK